MSTIFRNHMCDTRATAPINHFCTKQYSASRGKGVTRLSLHCYYAFWLARSDMSLISISGIIWDGASWASHVFERTTGKVTANLERNVSRHTKLLWFNA
ncbi:UNVERIFIED_CONTAM: hypothetical protein NCL1_37418 [Trichonephila clavipes]